MLCWVDMWRMAAVGERSIICEKKMPSQLVVANGAVGLLGQGWETTIAFANRGFLVFVLGKSLVLAKQVAVLMAFWSAA